MIGIYQDNFIDYLKSFLGDRIKITRKNIIVPCCFCGEHTKKQKHYHLYISTEIPIYHCFNGECNNSGTISKFFNKLEGKDKSEIFIDKEKIKKIKPKEISINTKSDKKKIVLPEIDETNFINKTMFLKGRLQFSNQPLKSINGLIFDINKFTELNKITDQNFLRMKDYLHSNFIGFLTEKESIIVFRNIDSTSKFRYFKQFLSETFFLDYYKLYGSDENSNDVVISEGIFDIFNEQIFNYTGLKNKIKLYAAALSTSYESLIKSIVFNEQIFKLNIHVLSDNGIHLNYYKKIKRNNQHIINTFNVYYNKKAKDFGDSLVEPEKIIL